MIAVSIALSPRLSFHDDDKKEKFTNVYLRKEAFIVEMGA